MLIVSGLTFQTVQMCVIVPYVLKNRPEKFWDKIPGTHQYKNLREYMIWCKLNKKSIFWYKFQIYMQFVIGLFFILTIIFGAQLVGN